MYYIVGDIGNTSTRICLFKNQKLLNRLFLIQKIFFVKNNIKKTFKRFVKKELKKNILFSCVVPSAFKKIKKALKEEKL